MSATRLTSWPTRTLGLAERMFGAVVARRVFQPLVADWAHDLSLKTSVGARMRATLQWTLACARTSAVVGLGQAAPWRMPRALVRQVWSTLAVGTGLGLVLPIAAFGAWQELSTAGALVLVTDTSKIALPLALAPASVVMATTALIGMQECRWRLIGLTALVLAAQLALVGWAAPALARLEDDARNVGRPAFASFPPTPVTLPADQLLTPPAAHEPLTLSAYARRQEMWNRAAWLAWPIATAVLGWRVGRHRVPSTRRVAPAVVSWAVCVGTLLAPMVLVSWLGNPFAPPPVAVRFLPNELLLAAAWLLKPSQGAAAGGARP